MVHKVDDDTYELVRQPYMKYSKVQYYTITTLLYMINILTVMAIMINANNDIFVMSSINELLLLWKSPI